MKIIHQDQERMSIERFAEKHNLTMVVIRESLLLEPGKFLFHAHFNNTSVECYAGIVFLQGIGDTEKQAISGYAAAISGERLLNYSTGHRILIGQLE